MLALLLSLCVGQLVGQPITENSIQSKGRLYPEIFGVSAGLKVRNTRCYSSASVPTIPSDTVGFAATAVEDAILFCGGWLKGYRNECFMFVNGSILDSSTGSWQSFPAMVQSRASFTLTAVGSTIIGTGGAGNFTMLSSVEAYEGQRWQERVGWELSSPRLGHCAVQYGRDTLVITGGTSSKTGLGHSYLLKAVEQLDLAAGKWRLLASMVYARAFHSCMSYSKDGAEYIMVAGGYYKGFTMKSVERYSSASREWKELQGLQTPRWSHQMGVLNGYITVLGGKREFDLELDSTQYLNGSNWMYGSSLQESTRGSAVLNLTC